MKRLAVRIALGIIAVGGVVAIPAKPADAHYVCCNLWGRGQFDTLGVNQLNTGDQVGMWQAFLFDFRQIPCGSFDGIFGPATVQGTKNLQAFWGLPADGVVGQQTWSKAADWLTLDSGDGYARTYWTNHFSSRSNLAGLGRYSYTYGGIWEWMSEGEDPYTYSLPNWRWIDSNHPGRFFSMNCARED